VLKSPVLLPSEFRALGDPDYADLGFTHDEEFDSGTHSDWLEPVLDCLRKHAVDAPGGNRSRE